MALRNLPHIYIEAQLGMCVFPSICELWGETPSVVYYLFLVTLTIFIGLSLFHNFGMASLLF